jgi:hypothetical protein
MSLSFDAMLRACESVFQVFPTLSIVLYVVFICYAKIKQGMNVACFMFFFSNNYLCFMHIWPQLHVSSLCCVVGTTQYKTVKATLPYIVASV